MQLWVEGVLGHVFAHLDRFFTEPLKLCRGVRVHEWVRPNSHSWLDNDPVSDAATPPLEYINIAITVSFQALSLCWKTKSSPRCQVSGRLHQVQVSLSFRAASSVLCLCRVNLNILNILTETLVPFMPLWSRLTCGNLSLEAAPNSSWLGDWVH